MQAEITTLFMFQSERFLVQYLAAPEVLQAIGFWLFRSLLKASWNNVPVVAIAFVITTLAVLPNLRQLTALRLGDARAVAIGVNVQAPRVKRPPPWPLSGRSVLSTSRHRTSRGCWWARISAPCCRWPP